MGGAPAAGSRSWRRHLPSIVALAVLAMPASGCALLSVAQVEGGRMASPVVDGSGLDTHRSPDAAAQPRAVLEAYLAALRAGDCLAARAFAAPTFTVGNGELCGALTIVSVTLDQAGPATPTDDVAVFSTMLTVTAGDKSMPDGTYAWFYDLGRQPDGAWLLTGGGSGP